MVVGRPGGQVGTVRHRLRGFLAAARTRVHGVVLGRRRRRLTGRCDEQCRRPLRVSVSSRLRCRNEPRIPA